MQVRQKSRAVLVLFGSFLYSAEVFCFCFAAKHVKIDVCHEPVRLLVLNAPEDLEVNKMQAFFPGCVKVTRLGMTSFEATFATVKGAMEAMELAADTKIEGRRLLCYFCKRSATS